MSAKVAIVTTLKGARALLPSFVSYHLRTGFHSIYLFFDDPEDEMLEWCRGRDNLVVFKNDASLQAQWREVAREEPALRSPLRNARVTHEHRQMLNVGVAMRHARQQGLDWLVHIDVDELFLSERDSVPDYFGALSEYGIDNMAFVAHEAVPESLECSDVFRDSTLFKICPLAMDFPQSLWFARRFPHRLAFFNAYVGNKGAMRLASTSVPLSVHGFVKPYPQLRTALAWGLASLLAGNSLRNLKFAPATQVCHDPVVLHYPCPSFVQFVAKYRDRLATASRLFGGAKKLARLPFFKFETAAWDVVRRGDLAEIEAFYRSQVMFAADELDELVKRGLARRIDAPSHVLRAAASA